MTVICLLIYNNVVGVAEGHAPRLPDRFHAAVSIQGTLEFLQNLQRRHRQEPTAELGDNIDVVFVFRAAGRNGGVDRHRTLRVEVLDLVVERRGTFEVLSHRLVAVGRLHMKRRRKLEDEGDLCQQAVQMVAERVNPGMLYADIHFCSPGR